MGRLGAEYQQVLSGAQFHGKMRFFAQIMVLPGLALGLTGIGWFVATGSAYTFLPYNNLLVACALLVLTIVVIVPKLSSRFLVFPNRVLTAGALLFAIEALYANVSTLLNLPSLPTIASDLGFAVFLFSLAYVAAQRVFAGERRLLSIESELEVARQIQSAILPASIPEVKNLSIAASYQPMTAVAGRFLRIHPNGPAPCWRPRGGRFWTRRRGCAARIDDQDGGAIRGALRARSEGSAA